jgi:hypothetical protein
MWWWPGWDSVESTSFWSHFWFWFGIGCLFMLGASEIVSHIYGLRKDELHAVAESNATEQRQRDADAAEARRIAEVTTFQQKLGNAEKELAEVKRQTTQRSLNQQQKQTIIDVLLPFRGQKIDIICPAGDAEANTFAEDFISVFEAAGWDHGGACQSMRHPPMVGLTISVRQPTEGQFFPAAMALIEAINAIGWPHAGFLNAGSPEQITIQIGRKPLYQ